MILRDFRPEAEADALLAAYRDALRSTLSPHAAFGPPALAPGADLAGIADPEGGFRVHCSEVADP